MPRSERSLLSSPPLATAVLCVLLGAVDLTVIAAILPGMITDLGVNTSDIDRYIWIVSGYLIAYIVAIPIVGRLSDLLGRRALFLASLAIFLAGSIVCAMASDLETIILGRSIQGFGGGGLLPVALALTGDLLPPTRRRAGIGVVSAIDTLGWVIGPVYGALIEAFAPGASEHWRWVFWINIPLLIAAIALVWRTFPHERGIPFTALRRFDLPGAIILAGTLVALNIALSAGGEFGSATGSGLRALGGTANPLADYVVPLLIAAVIGVTILVVLMRHVATPILPRELFQDRAFLLICLANFLIGIVLMVGMADVPIVVSLLGTDHASETSAAILASYTIAIAATTILGERIRQLRDPRTPISGVVLAAIGYAILHPLLADGGPWRMIVGLVIAGVGLGLLIAPLGALALDRASDRERGSAAGSALMFRLLGMTIGMSTLTAIGVRRLQTLTDRLDPITRGTDESTATFLARQQTFLEERVLPLSVQVIRETFLVAAIAAVIALVPIWLLRQRRRD